MTPRTLAAVFLAPFAASCAIGPRYTPPAPAMPTNWQEAPPAPSAFDGSTLEHWWTAFHDPLLDDLVARAIDGNLDLKIAAARVREARAARGIAASAALPQVGVHGQSVRGERSETVPPFKAVAGEGSPFGSRTQNTFEACFDAGWELDVFGGVRSDVEAAVAQVQSCRGEPPRCPRDATRGCRTQLRRASWHAAPGRDPRRHRSVAAGHARSREGAVRHGVGHRPRCRTRPGPARSHEEPAAGARTAGQTRPVSPGRSDWARARDDGVHARGC